MEEKEIKLTFIFSCTYTKLSQELNRNVLPFKSKGDHCLPDFFVYVHAINHIKEMKQNNII
ncbi:hypothetical protein LQ50_04120 [Halalkalibacter okhensis]|uniref:Uncharacterized protein n=1 Tax=Halalkalibacter okhensis TaxID=333138 RepID=A0A0B0IFS6_9BACI|nr:hypothetical protein LQ50_04120 [Halalkalibacter okhensis]